MMISRKLKTILSRNAVRALPSTSTATNTFTTTTKVSADDKLRAPPLTYILGEEMTRYCMQLVLDKCISPHIDTTEWEFFDLSCVSRDNTEDQVLHDAVESGSRLGAIFKEPTITPTEEQKELLGLKKAWGSPNGAMRRGWNGITISRDTIHIEGMELGFKRPVLFERQAVGGEYSAGWGLAGKGSVRTIFTPREGGEDVVIDERELDDEQSAIVTYSNPLDGVTDLAHIFFERCLKNNCTPYIVTKKTVFKWQDGFWTRCKDVFDAEYKTKFLEAGLLDNCGGELTHVISDAACMQIIRWTEGGFGMACHNYDGDMLTDEMAQVHRSPGFINSSLIGKSDDGSLIKEFEASHGTVSDMWHAHLAGQETSLNPLGLVEALISAMQHSVTLQPDYKDAEKIHTFTEALRKCMHTAMVDGKGTRDLCGKDGLTTEEFVDHIASMLSGEDADVVLDKVQIQREGSFEPEIDQSAVDEEAMQQLFEELDLDGNGSIDLREFTKGLTRLGVAPRKHIRNREDRV